MKFVMELDMTDVGDIAEVNQQSIVEVLESLRHAIVDTTLKQGNPLILKFTTGPVKITTVQRYEEFLQNLK